VYCIAAGIGVAATPGRAAAQFVGGEAVNGECGRGAGGDHENEQEEPVIGAAAFGDRHDRQPFDAGLNRHATAHEQLHDRRQCVDEQARQDAGNQAKGCKKNHRGQRMSVGFLRAARRRGPRSAEKRDAEGAHKTRGRERRRKRQQGADGGYRQLEPP